MLITQELTDRQYYAINRKMKKIKLKEIADVLKCSIPLLSMYESNRTNMNDHNVTRYRQIIDNK